MKKTISVIVPVYNVENYLNECIESILRQSFSDFELILVDDGSTDGSGKICDYYKQQDKRVIVLHRENEGVSKARSIGVKIAKSDLICFIDGDDLIHEDYLSSLFEGIKHKNADISVCRSVSFRKPSDITKYQCAHSGSIVKVMDKERALIELCSLEKYDMALWAKLYRRKLFYGVSFPDLPRDEDLYITYKLFFNVESVNYIETPLYFYRQRSNGRSKNKVVDDYYVNGCKEQLHFFHMNCQNVEFAARTMLSMAYLFKYNRYIVGGIRISKEEKKQIRRYIGKDYCSIIVSHFLGTKRKMQFSLFLLFPQLYNVLLKKNWRNNE